VKSSTKGWNHEAPLRWMRLTVRVDAIKTITGGNDKRSHPMRFDRAFSRFLSIEEARTIR
jgi:hypothetical protein